MAGTARHSSAIVWILLSEALALIANYTGTIDSAEEFLLHYLREGLIRWTFWKQEGIFDETETYAWHLQHNRIYDHSNPGLSNEYRWWRFWVEDDLLSRSRTRHVTIDRDSSSALCTADASEFGSATRYKLSLIRIARNDVIERLQLAGLMPREAPSIAPSADTDDAAVSGVASPSASPPPPPKSPKPLRETAASWTAKAAERRPQLEGEEVTEWADRLLLYEHPPKEWDRETIANELYKLLRPQ